MHLTLASSAELGWSQRIVSAHHYLHAPVDVRCSPLAYVVWHADERMGCLIFGRPEATRCYPWYGSVADKQSGRARLTRWEVLNLARVWLDPRLQQGGADYVSNAATQVIAAALRRVVVDYLVAHPPCFVEEPYEIREVLSYCDTQRHRGTIYRAANFELMRENKRGIQTYAREVRRLTTHERLLVEKLAEQSARSRRYRSQRAARELAVQGALF